MKRTTGMGLIAAAAVGTYFLLSGRPAAPVVRAAEPVAERLIAGAGRVEPASEEFKIGSEVDGRLRSVPVEEGQFVRTGDVVAVLDNADFEARVELAAATVAERAAALERLRNGSRVEQRREAEATVREAQAVHDNALSERLRRAWLLERGAISRMEFEVAERELSVAKARLDAVRERKALVIEESRPEDLLRAQAEVDRARAQWNEARALLEKTIIRSPLSGVVLRKKLKAGESVSSRGDAVILTLGDCSRLRVRVDVDETDVARLRVGQTAWVRAEAYGERKFHGRVTRIGQILGRKTIRTDEPAERLDTKILETLVELEAGVSIPVGLRVDAFIDPRS